MEPNPKKIFVEVPQSKTLPKSTRFGKIIRPVVRILPRKVAYVERSVVDFTEDISQQNVYSASQGENIAHRFEEAESSIKIDEEVANLLSWLAEEQGITPELALKKAVATAAYIHDITTSQQGRLLVQRRDNSVGEIILK